jgi:hypothetical protein
MRRGGGALAAMPLGGGGGMSRYEGGDVSAAALNDFAARPGTIWQAHKHTRHTSAAAPTASPTATGFSVTDMNSTYLSENSEAPFDRHSPTEPGNRMAARRVFPLAREEGQVLSFLALLVQKYKY